MMSIRVDWLGYLPAPCPECGRYRLLWYPEYIPDEGDMPNQIWCEKCKRAFKIVQSGWVPDYDWDTPEPFASSQTGWQVPDA